VISRGTVQIPSLTITWRDINDVSEPSFESKPCYDIFTETHKPQIFINYESQLKHAYVIIPGTCNAIYKFKDLDGANFAPTLLKYYNPNDDAKTANIKILSSIFAPSISKIFYTSKVYNSDTSFLNTLDINTFANGVPVILTANESTPILAIEPSFSNVYVATSGFDRIYKYSAVTLAISGVAVLPPPLKPVSSMYSLGGFLYLVTSEPNAVIGRISENNFCDSFCSRHGYCDGSAKTCACIDDYAKDTAFPTQFICAPKHYIQQQETLKSEKGAATAFGVMFGLATLAGIFGWFLWFRGQSYSNI